MSTIGFEIKDKKYFCKHTTSIQNGTVSWEMKEFVVTNPDGSETKGVACPKCHRTMLSDKKDSLINTQVRGNYI